MPSWQARAVSLYLRATRKRRHSTRGRGERSLVHGLPAASPSPALRERITTEGMPEAQVTRVAPPGGRPVSRGVIIYWHGGAFVNGIATQHWQLIDHLAAATGREVLVPRYGLAPAHDVGEVAAVLDAIVAGVPADVPLHVIGDSAGGTLALLQAQRHPGRIDGLTLLAPWLDLSMGNPALDAIEPHDPWLTRAGLRPIADAWAGGRDLRDPAVSPLFGDLDLLPPTLTLVGDRDLCLPDCELLAERAGAAVTLVVGTGLPHVYPLLPIPEAHAARDQIVQHVEATLGAQD